MLYVAGTNVYISDAGGKVHPVNIGAKDKVIERRELDSVNFKAEKEVVELPRCAVAATADEVIARFNISQNNPCKFDAAAHKAMLAEQEAPVAPEAPVEPEAASED